VHYSAIEGGGFRNLEEGDRGRVHDRPGPQGPAGQPGSQGQLRPTTRQPTPPSLTGAFLIPARGCGRD
jgi:hypothetical protein